MKQVFALSLSLLVPVALLASDQPTFVDDIASIVHDNCSSCHRPGEIGPMSLRTYEEVRPWARSIARQVENRDMPPWDADPGYGPFANDSSLGNPEIAAITRWVAAGAPRGTGDEPVYEAPRRDGEWVYGDPDWIFEFDPVVVSADGPDQFVDVPIPGFAEDKWIKKIQILPGDGKAVHHFILWRTDENGNQDGWIDGWAANTVANEFPEGTARFMPAGRRMIGDFHYHPYGEETTVKSKIGLWFIEPEEVEKELVNLWIMNVMFRIPAGDPNYESRAEHTFEEAVLIRSLTPHMHYRGKDMKYTAHYPDGSEKELLSVSRYDFNWQTNYAFVEPIPLPAGTRVEVVAHWDNSADNLDNPDPTRDVGFGVESTDEMLIGFVDYVAASDD